MFIESVVSGLIVDALKGICKWIHSISVEDRSLKKKIDIIQLESISDFWEKKRGLLSAEKYISIQGSLSKYAPMLIGPPRAKRELHRQYRRSIPASDYDKKRSVIDANLSYTAGQMVWRFEHDDLNWMYFGLYHSIVRNSIPVFIEKSYYYKIVESFFKEERNRYVIEAKIVGKLKEIPENFVNKFIKENQLAGKIIPSILSSSQMVPLAVLIDGKDTSVKFIGSSRYLDGDIWIGLELGGEQFFVSRFLDIADYQELLEESTALKKDIEELYPNGKIIFQFDQVEKLISNQHQLVDVDDLINQFTRQ